MTHVIALRELCCAVTIQATYVQRNTEAR